MTASARAIQVYYADRRALSDSTIASLVTADDRQRLTPEMHERRRGEYLAARALLRYALADCTHSDSAAFRIEIAAGGKPECVGGPSISLSHSGDIVVCAIASAGAVGIDVEQTSRPRARAALAEQFFTPLEAQWLALDPEPRFRMLWVLKEAYLKALGVGLAGGLSSLECRIDPPSIAACAADGAPAPQLFLLEGRGCYVGVAASGLRPQIDIGVRRFAGGEHRDAVAPLSLMARTA